MNERIKQLLALADQMTLTAIVQTDIKFDSEDFNAIKFEKFAELIVRECMNLRNDPHIQPFLHGWKHLRDDNSHKQYATGWVEGTEVYRCGIRDYFGVEE